VVLNCDEVARLIAAAPNPKYQAALSVAYGAGLLASDVCALKDTDIDGERITLRVEEGKDLYALLSPVQLERLSYASEKEITELLQLLSTFVFGHG